MNAIDINTQTFIDKYYIFTVHVKLVGTNHCINKRSDVYKTEREHDYNLFVIPVENIVHEAQGMSNK